MNQISPNTIDYTLSESDQNSVWGCKRTEHPVTTGAMPHKPKEHKGRETSSPSPKTGSHV